MGGDGDGGDWFLEGQCVGRGLMQLGCVYIRAWIGGGIVVGL